MINSIKEDLVRIINSTSGLFLEETEKQFVIYGLYQYSLEDEKIIMEGNCKLRFVVSKSFPNELPQLYIENLPLNMTHVFTDGSACMATLGQQIDFISTSTNLETYWTVFVNSFIYSVEYFREYNRYPYGEREHGPVGQLTYYIENWDVDYSTLLKLSNIVYKRIYRGHNSCPCGSGVKIRFCHGKYILPFLTNEFLREPFLREVFSIIKFMEKDKYGN